MSQVAVHAFDDASVHFGAARVEFGGFLQDPDEDCPPGVFRAGGTGGFGLRAGGASAGACGLRAGGYAGFEGYGVSDRAGKAGEDQPRLRRRPGLGGFRFWRGFPIPQGFCCGGAGELHAQLCQFAAVAQVARCSFSGTFGLTGAEGAK